MTTPTAASTARHHDFRTGDLRSMYQAATGTRYSATDLLTWHGCAHASWLDAAALEDRALSAWLAERRRAERTAVEEGTAFPDPAATRGNAHEAAMLARLEAQGLHVVTIQRPDPRDGDALASAAAETEKALRDGADVVYQAALLGEPWFGYADFLVKVPGVPSDFGDFAYEVRDTKLARHPSAGALLQMAHYGELLERLQGVAPPRLVVWLGTGEEFAWAYADAVPYLRELRRRFEAFHAAPPVTAPEPVDHCGPCRWAERCAEEWGPADLQHVQGLTRQQRTLLRAHGIASVEELATATERPAGMAAATFTRLHDQAAVQAGAAPFALVRPQPRTGALAGTPASHSLDIYFDLEGDPYAGMPTLDYLWAFCDRDENYEFRWAHSAAEERVAFTWFLDELRRREQQDPDGEWRVYHYNSYEVTSLLRVAEKWPDPDEAVRLTAEVQRFVRERFDDLYRRVEAGLRTRAGSTSLKVVEKLAGYDRTATAAAVGRADDSIKAYEAYLASDDAQRRAALLDGIRQYNEHDVRATLAVHGWLRRLAAELGPDDLLDDDVEEYTPSETVRARAEETKALQDRLTAAAEAGAALPSGLSAAGARMLASLLEWHRRESVVAYVDFLRLKDWAANGDSAPSVSDPAEDEGARVRRGTEHESCLLDVRGPLQVDDPEPGKRARRRVYACAPGAWKVTRGTDLQEVRPDGDRKPVTVKVLEHDPVRGTFSFARQEVPADLGPFVVSPFNENPVVWQSLMQLAEHALADTPPPSAAAGFALLDCLPPLPAGQMAPRDGEGAADRARRLVATMTGGVLPVQGPPGTGKTTLAVEVVLDEIAHAYAAGRVPVIGVVANSHRVIDNLVKKVAGKAAARGITLMAGHVGQPADAASAAVARIDSSGKLGSWIDDRRSAGDACVVGATKFGWSRPELEDGVDLLLVDEAGQLSLADALAVSPAARRIVALGDPQQLAAPVQAAHDDEVRVSALEHLARGAAVLPPRVGVFLDVSHRMHPDLCAAVGRLAYDGALTASRTAGLRAINCDGGTVVAAGHTVPVRPGIAWVPVEGSEDAQAAAVQELIGALCSGGVQVADLDDEGQLVERPLNKDDVLVVAPHNAHVNRLSRLLGNGVRIGTVDKFQGQEAHVVVFSLGRLASAASDVPFLYETNRINVALSRARVLAAVVAHPDAVFPPVAQPEHLRLASRFATAVAP